MAEKTDFMAQAKAQMEQWTAEMKKMQDKMMEAGAQGQSQMMKQWDDMNTQRKKIEAQMEEMGKANMEAAKEVQKSMESAWKEMEKKDGRRPQEDDGRLKSIREMMPEHQGVGGQGTANPLFLRHRRP